MVEGMLQCPDCKWWMLFLPHDVEDCEYAQAEDIELDRKMGLKGDQNGS